MGRLFIFIAGLSGFLATALGALGAHILQGNKIDSAIYQTAVQYQFYHSLSLLAVGVLFLHQANNLWLKASGGLFILGILLFCGSLYTRHLATLNALSPFAPWGGLALMMGWITLCVGALQLHPPQKG